MEEKDWTEVMLSKRDYQDRQDRQGLGEVRVSQVSKRKVEGKATRRTKKRKYNIIGENWGLGEIDDFGHDVRALMGEEGVDTILPAPLVQEQELIEVETECVEIKPELTEVCSMKDVPETTKKNVDELNEFENGTRNETVDKEDNKKEKRKVWTKLKSGLYAWRYRSVPRKATQSAKNSECWEQAPQSSFQELPKWAPALLPDQNICIKTGSNSAKRKVNLEGGDKMPEERESGIRRRLEFS